MKTILVSGASSGLGRATAEYLAQRGFCVYACARSFQNSTAAIPKGCIPLYLDVTDEDSIRCAFARVLNDGNEFFALINCAAFLSIAPCETIDPEELLRVLNTNFLGTVRMTQHALPIMRKQGFGRIINFSSINGLLAIPFQGAYTASKFAIEGWSETLSQEVSRFGIHVSLIEPGDCRGGSERYRHLPSASDVNDSVYCDFLDAGAKKIREDEANGLLQERVAHAVYRILQSKRPPAHKVVANLTQRSSVWLKAILPRRLFDRIVTKYYAPQKKRE